MPPPTPSNPRGYGLQWRNTYFTEHRLNTPIESFSVDRGTATQLIYVNFGDRRQAVLDFIGDTVVLPFDAMLGFSPISRIVPYSHPDYRMDALFDNGQDQSGRYASLWVDSCTDIRGVTPVEGVDGTGRSDTGVAFFEEASMMLNYFTPDYNILTDEQLKSKNANSPDESSLLRYVRVRFDPVVKTQTIPTVNPLFWKEVAHPEIHNKPAILKSSVPLYENDLTIEWVCLPLRAIPFATFKNYANKTNSGEFGKAGSLLPGAPLEAETLLLTSAPAVRLITRPLGFFSYNVTYRMRYYPQGVNKFFCVYRQPPAFVEAVIKATAAGPELGKLFSSVDYNGLFRAP